MDHWVFVDTCIWAAFFDKSTSPHKARVAELLDTDRIALIGPIVAEVLLGFRRKDQADWVASRLRMAHIVETTWDDWRDAADLARQLAGTGHKLPLTDLVVAAVVKRCHASLYTSDPHDDVIPEIKRH